MVIFNVIKMNGQYSAGKLNSTGGIKKYFQTNPSSRGEGGGAESEKFVVQAVSTID